MSAGAEVATEVSNVLAELLAQVSAELAKTPAGVRAQALRIVRDKLDRTRLAHNDRGAK